MSLRSSLSPRSPTNFSKQGFQPLDNSSTSKMPYDADIPLTNVRTASSSTGARKLGEGALNDLGQQPTFQDDEKKGLFQRGAAGKRQLKKIGSRKRIGTDGEEQSVNAMGRFYNKVVNFSIVTRYFVYVLPIALALAAPIIVGATIRTDTRIAGEKMYLFFLWIEIVWLSIWVSKLISKALPYVFMFLCGVVSSGTRKYALVIRALEIPLSLVGWAVTSLVTFTALTSTKVNGRSPEGWVDVMKRVLGPILIAALLFLAEKTVIQLISINYHRRSFDGRIKDSKHTIHLLGLLYEASRTLFPMYCPEFIEEDYLINDSIESMLAKASGRKDHRRSGSATPMRLIGDVGRFGDKVTSVFGNIASEITGKEVFNPNSAHSVVIEALEKTKSSEALAKRLWMSFVVEGSESLVIDDLREVLGPAHKEEAEESFYALDNDANGDISLDEMIMKVVEISRDRKSIANSMRDVGQAIGVLDQVLVVILFVIVVFIFVAFQDTNFITTLATAGTTLLSLSFVFAVTTQEFLGSCIFLFVKHPYDVGDRVDIVGSEKEYLVVEQISLLYTIFKRIDNMKMVQVPNIVLNNLWIENVTRSKAMKEQLDMFISFDTTLEDIEILRKEMEEFVRAPDNSRDFQPDIVLEATGIGNMDKLQLKVEIKHKSNWHNETVRAARRSKFMCALVLALRKVPIYAPGGGGEALGGPTNPGYTVAISDSLAAEAREKAQKDKDAKRLVPLPAASPAAGKSSSVDFLDGEAAAAESMNARRPTADAAHSGGELRDDEHTLREEDSPEHVAQRNNNIEEMRQGLLKRETTRGRRKPGETIPDLPTTGDGPGLIVTQASPILRRNNNAFTDVVLDEEAEMGFARPSQNPYGTQYTPDDYDNTGQAYSVYPQQQAGQPLQNYTSAPATSQPASGSSGTGRLRKLSLSSKQQGANQGSSTSGQY